MDPLRIIGSSPAPSFRGAQERVLRDIRDALANGNDVTLIHTPTGNGKSLLVHAITESATTVDETSPAQATNAYHTTLQTSQLDDVAEDGLLSDLGIIHGRSNYNCTIRGEEDMPVDRASCTRKRGSGCPVRRRYPYFPGRAIASNRQITAMTFAYFMQTAGSDVFRERDVVVVDEVHELAERVEMYATIDLKSRTAPVQDNIGAPDVVAVGNPVERAPRLAETLVGVCKYERDELLTKPELIPEEVTRHDRLQELIDELNWPVKDYHGPQSPTMWVADQHDGEGSPIATKPSDPTKYLKHTAQDRGSRFALLPAAILDRAALCRSVGLDPSKVASVDVEYTFPVENRPPHDVVQGKMTYEYRDETLPKIARLTIRLTAKHPDKKGLIHCHLYVIQAELRHRFAEMDLSNHARDHDHDD